MFSFSYVFLAAGKSLSSSAGGSHGNIARLFDERLR